MAAHHAIDHVKRMKQIQHNQNNINTIRKHLNDLDHNDDLLAKLARHDAQYNTMLVPFFTRQAQQYEEAAMHCIR